MPLSAFIFPILLSSFPLLAASTHQGLIQVGYWNYGTEFPATDINSTLFTHLICAFADINSSTYQLSIPSSFFSFSNDTKSKNPSLLTLLSIGGGNSDYTTLSTMISQPSHRKTFIDSSLATARRYGFDGLDFSWPRANTSTQMTNMATLFKEWRDAINDETNTNSTTQSSSSNSNPLILTMAANFQPTLDIVTLPINSIRTNIDWVHVLNYDYHSPSYENLTNGHSALYDPFSQRNTNFGIKEWISGGLSADKLVLALPFYGYAWKLADPDKHYIGAPSTGPVYSEGDSAMSYKQIKAYIDQYKAKTEYNSTYVQNYCYSGTTWIGYDDTQAVTAKVSYLKDQGLLGYHIWEISQDDNWELSQVAAQAIGVSGDSGETKNHWTRKLAIILPTIAGIVLLLGFISCYYLKRRQGSGGKGRDGKGRVKASTTKKGGFNSLETNADGLRAFSLGVIKESTDNFAFCNKLGHGGYGPVYKGKLEDGQVIAVKRLSDSSEQGLEEFENEVTLLARLQHVNLVRILGFCTEGGEKMLIYEYMPNGSLDSYLFDPVKRLLLDWRKRVQIVEGVIQGLLYLQEYSRLSIIHRDIKPSNVLLDITMTPKIADFGMARIFQKNDPEANTGKIVGTYGYVPPEYATRGAYSVKLDVYSFGVLLLQMISGKTTFSSYGLTGIQAVSDQAYAMWEEGKGKEFMDPTLDDTNSTCSMATCLQVALLCVQDNPEDRPTMLEVSSMINSEIKDLPIPNIPAFSVRRGSERHTESSQSGYTVNEATISEMIPR